MTEYHQIMNKQKSVKQLKTIKYHMMVATIKDIFIKSTSIALTTYFILYIFMEGNGDFSLFILALSNIMMFTGFGMRSMAIIYDKYIEEHLPAIQEIINKLKDQAGLIPLEGEKNEV